VARGNREPSEGEGEDEDDGKGEMVEDDEMKERG
jgi:hypothetical protein